MFFDFKDKFFLGTIRFYFVPFFITFKTGTKKWITYPFIIFVKRRIFPSKQ